MFVIDKIKLWQTEGKKKKNPGNHNFNEFIYLMVPKLGIDLPQTILFP